MAEGVFDLLMGNDVAPRKDFIIDSAGSLAVSYTHLDVYKRQLQHAPLRSRGHNRHPDTLSCRLCRMCRNPPGHSS